MPKVTFAEAKQIVVAAWLNEDERWHAKAMGDTFGSDDSTQGVLIDECVSRSVEFFFMTYRTERLFAVGKLWINNARIGAATSRNWVLQVFGREKLGALTKLAENIAATFNVDVHVRLEKEEAERSEPAGP